MDLMMPLVAIAGTLLFFWLGRAWRVFPMAANFEGKPISIGGIAVALGVLAGLQWRQCVNVGLPWNSWAGTHAVARLAMMPITASSSSNVNALFDRAVSFTVSARPSVAGARPARGPAPRGRRSRGRCKGLARCSSCPMGRRRCARAALPTRGYRLWGV
jgi:hypothetical protein